MYKQNLVHNDDRDFQRIVFRKPVDSPVRDCDREANLPLATAVLRT